MRTVAVPGDKSLTHRALLFAALATGRSVIRGALDGSDTRSTAAALRALGCAVPSLDGTMAITGKGMRHLTAPAEVIDCGNSGTTARLLMGVLAPQPFSATLTGDASLRSRPMRRVTQPLAAMGARFEELDDADRLPVRVVGGPLRPFAYASPHASAQVKSALLLAGLCGGVAVTVTEPRLSRDHTERMLSHMGVPLRRGVDAAGATVSLEPVERLAALEFDVPGDFSSAAFIIALAMLLAEEPVTITGVGLNPGRTGFLDVARRMGGVLRVENERLSCGEPMGDVVVERSVLRGTSVDAAEIPSLIDEVPIIAALAARAEGATTIAGAAELRVKESDRIAAMVTNLHAVGAVAEELPDGLVVQGSDARLRGRVRTLHDHRIAMAFGVLGALPGSDIELDDRGVVAVSYPGFWTLLHEMTAA